MMKWNKYLTVAVGLGLSFALSACGSSSDSKSGAQSAAVQNEGQTSKEPTQLLNGEATQITGNGDSVVIDGAGAMEKEGLIRISSGGIYALQGEFQNFQVVVEARKDDVVQLNMNGVTMSNENYAVINGVNCETLILNVEEGTVNTLSDGSTYEKQADDDEVNSVVFSKDDICLAGDGTLVINASYEDAIRSKDTLEVISGNFEVTSKKDAFQGKDELVIFGGDFMVNAGDDAFHTENTLTVNDGNINITNCYEGLEGIEVFINGGKIAVVASDDGINAAGGSDEGEDFFGKGGFGDVNEDAKVIINDGYVYVNAEGDGIDSNGTVEVNGGTLLVDGPTNGGNGALDYAISANVNGGYVIAVGSAAMASGFSESSKQYSWHYQAEGMQGNKELLTVIDETGEVIVSYQPSKEYQSVVISIPEFEKGSTYQMMLGGSAVDADEHGFSKQADISEAVNGGSIVIESIVNGSSSNGFGGFGGSAGFEEDFEGGRGGKGGKGNRGDMLKPEAGEVPELPEGFEMPEGGQMPEDGQMPQMPDGMEPPEIPEGGMEPPTEGMEPLEKPQDMEQNL